RIRGKLEFRHLTFGYDPHHPVLHDVSVSIRPGEKLAIVGPTGSGKSTLIRLLGRFYDFPDGTIFLDDIDLNQIKSTDVRRRIGVVLQDFHIFSGSILDNIILGNPNISRERAIEAARMVSADSFIEALPDQYDTLLVERGQNLSQGQRQLLAFARVLAADPEILVLDEATASIDTETELLIQQGLKKIMKGRTSILIAHRLQTIAEADKILVLKDGRVKEFGTHEELMELKGVYYTLNELQFQNVSLKKNT
ncbi:MAG: ATP-binding cassette domain-containing protein, partial [Proteobacteria bacterium]|nr:ATP-binding cassette domain-containing protein [Pseudomonadota bacterium]